MRGKCCRQGPLVVGYTPSFKPAHLHNALSSRTHLPIPPQRHLPLSPILMLIVSQHILITCTRSMDDFTPFSPSYGYIESNVTTYTDHFLARSISTHPSFSPTLPWRLSKTSKHNVLHLFMANNCSGYYLGIVPFFSHLLKSPKGTRRFTILSRSCHDCSFISCDHSLVPPEANT